MTLNCEYQLHKINSAIPLRHNPFLSHWVEALQRLEGITKAPSKVVEAADKTGALDQASIAAARRKVIEAILVSNSLSSLASKTPRSLLESSTRSQTLSHSFDLTPYITMLEEEGIYEKKSTATNPSASTSATQVKPRSWKQCILDDLDSAPETAIEALTHLPVDLQCLDFMTQLIQDETLQANSIDPFPVLQNFIQHALRQIEQMGDPASSSETFGAPTSSSAASPPAEPEDKPSVAMFPDLPEDAGHGREAQTRAVKLLLLFLRNLVRKDLVKPDEIYFEIQEICIRYVWIKEVREFRAFVHGDA
jgi:hypothetical protein